MVAGCWFKRDGRIIRIPTGPRSAIYRSADARLRSRRLRRLRTPGGGRKLPYATSIGCPYACNYCTDMVFYNRRFNAYDLDRVVDEVTDLVRRHRVDEVALVDSNFLVDVRRAIAIAQGFSIRGVKFHGRFRLPPICSAA